jgi:hypothetical protein
MDDKGELAGKLVNLLGQVAEGTKRSVEYLWPKAIEYMCAHHITQILGWVVILAAGWTGTCLLRIAATKMAANGDVFEAALVRWIPVLAMLLVTAIGVTEILSSVAILLSPEGALIFRLTK